MVTAKQLTSGERFLLDRRRRGESIVVASKRLGLSAYAYQLLEGGGELSGTREPRIARLEPYETAFVLRRRAGLAVADLANQLGLSRWWLTQMERGTAPCERLLEHWAAQATAKALRGGRRRKG